MPNVTATHRQKRLAALLSHKDFNGNKAAMGREFGFNGGAYIRQLIEGERPISEKTVARIEAHKGGRYRGWFDVKPAQQAEPQDNSQPHSGGDQAMPKNWPFEAEFNRFERLTERQKGRVEQALIDAIERIEAETAKGGNVAAA